MKKTYIWALIDAISRVYSSICLHSRIKYRIKFFTQNNREA